MVSQWNHSLPVGRSTSTQNPESLWIERDLLYINGVPTDCACGTAVKSIQTAHILIIQGEVIQLRIGFDPNGTRGPDQGYESSLEVQPTNKSERYDLLTPSVKTNEGELGRVPCYAMDNDKYVIEEMIWELYLLSNGNNFGMVHCPADDRTIRLYDDAILVAIVND
ncbi:hypothetical protein PHLCEN_2v13412 [Hermanssonia centrifuga]|uniref:Uncharacterized protein n=1 Tax=Hermanssonia centrifuga TaxID=98765 RepID=A0A2R6NFA4_9APHY|nr:hypothetical protein PHLCEN_2v13412 [Hermanssonia centrifuga]